MEDKIIEKVQLVSHKTQGKLREVFLIEKTENDDTISAKILIPKEYYEYFKAKAEYKKSTVYDLMYEAIKKSANRSKEFYDLENK